MQAGLIFGQMGLAERIIEGMKKELVSDYGKKYEDIKVIATGGMATMVDSGVSCIDVIDRRLTLDGLVEVYEKNKAVRKK